MSTAVGALIYLAQQSTKLNEYINGRIYPVLADQGAEYPLIVLSVISRAESPTQDEDSAVDTTRVQADVIAKDSASGSGYKIATDTYNAFRAAVVRYGGEIDTDDFEVLVDSVQSSNEGDDYDAELQLYRKRGDFFVRTKAA